MGDLILKVLDYDYFIWVYLVPLGRPRRRWVDNIRMDLQEVGMWTGLGWSRIETGGGRL